MMATNHALTGTLIALAVGIPAIALPAAFASHFVCDAIPHFDSSMESNAWLKSRKFTGLLIVDGSLCILLVAVLAIKQPEHWLLATVCAFLAASPDLFWINRWLKLKRGKLWYPNLFSKFAGWVQWKTGPFGVLTEAAWCAAALILLIPFLR
jgi:hypothetical protein